MYIYICMYVYIHMKTIFPPLNNKKQKTKTKNYLNVNVDHVDYLNIYGIKI